MIIQILRHSIGLVFNNLQSALKITGLLYLLPLLPIFLLSAQVAHVNPAEVNVNGIGIMAMVVSLLMLVAYFWIAVAWHRFVLLGEETGGVLPRFRGPRLLAYFGRLLQIGLSAMLVMWAFGLLVGIVTITLKLSPVWGVALSLLSVIPVLFLFFRLAPMLPGAALGSGVGFRQALEATRGHSGVCAGLALVAAIGTVVLELPAYAVQAPPLASLWVGIYSVAIGWVMMMIGLSILTTLYGLYIEKRSIA